MYFSSDIYLYFVNNFTDENCVILIGDHQALSSLPSTPRKDLQQSQIQVSTPGAHTLVEMPMQSSARTMKQNVEVVSSTSGDDSKINQIKTIHQVPSTSSLIVPSAFTLKTHEILNHFVQSFGRENLPLISSDVAIQLLKIQSSMSFTLEYICIIQYIIYFFCYFK